MQPAPLVSRERAVGDLSRSAGDPNRRGALALSDHAVVDREIRARPLGEHRAARLAQHAAVPDLKGIEKSPVGRANHVFRVQVGILGQPPAQDRSTVEPSILGHHLVAQKPSAQGEPPGEGEAPPAGGLGVVLADAEPDLGATLSSRRVDPGMERRLGLGPRGATVRVVARSLHEDGARRPEVGVGVAV